MKFTELIKDAPDAKLSSSRLWFNIANTAATAVFLYASFKASQHIPINLDGLTWYTLAYMGVVTSNKFANKFVEKRYGSNTEQKTPG
jgi:hypothetical protein